MNVQPDIDSTVSPPTDRVAAGAALVELVSAARQGDPAAWNALVERYTPLVRSVTRQYRLSVPDAEDVGQSVWLRLFENLSRLREVGALPGWIKSTTRNESLRVLAERRRTAATDPSVLAMHDQAGTDEGVDNDLLRRERDRAVVDGLAELAPAHRRLLVLLHAEPKVSYQDISRTLRMPPGSIGPTRARCLAKLRNTEALHKYAESAAPSNDVQAAQQQNLRDYHREHAASYGTPITRRHKVARHRRAESVRIEYADSGSSDLDEVAASGALL